MEAHINLEALATKTVAMEAHRSAQLLFKKPFDKKAPLLDPLLTN